MNPLVVYLLLLKATVTSFAGMGSLPQIHEDFVATRRVLTDEQLSRAVLVGRSTPGPVGAYVVSVGYFAAGWQGAVAGWLAMVTPALAAIPLFTLMRRWLHLARVRAAVDAVVIASAVLLLSSAFQLASDGFRQLSR
jgi:chromate transporter